MIEPFYNSLWVILEWQNILAMLVGVIGGIIFGAIPGLTATMGIALLIPLTFGMSPLMALGMMAGIHNGGSYGGAIPAVLLRIRARRARSPPRSTATRWPSRASPSAP